MTNLVSDADADLVDAVRAAEAAGAPVEGAFSRKRSFRKKFKKYGPSRTRRRTGDDRMGVASSSYDTSLLIYRGKS